MRAPAETIRATRRAPRRVLLCGLALSALTGCSSDPDPRPDAPTLAASWWALAS